MADIVVENILFIVAAFLKFSFIHKMNRLLKYELKTMRFKEL